MIRTIASHSPAQFFQGDKTVIDAFDGIIVYTDSLIVYYKYSNDLHNSIEFKSCYKLSDEILKVEYLESLNLIIVLSHKKKGIMRSNLMTLDSDLSKSVRYTFSVANKSEVYEKKLGLTHKIYLKNKFLCFYKYHPLNFLYTVTYVDGVDDQKITPYKFLSNNLCICYFDNISPIFKKFNTNQNQLNDQLILSEHYSPVKNDKLTKFLTDFTNDKLMINFKSFTDYGFIFVSFKKLYYIDFQSMQVKSYDSDSYIVNACQIDKSTLFILESTYRFVYLKISVDSSTLCPIDDTSEHIPIMVSDISVTKKFIFLSNRNTGLLAINKSNLEKIYIRDKSTISENDEINLFIGICHAFKLDTNELIISYTDGFNTVLTKNSLDLKLKKLDNYNDEAKFLGFIDNNNNQKLISNSGKLSFMTESYCNFPIEILSNNVITKILSSDIIFTTSNNAIYSDHIDTVDFTNLKIISSLKLDTSISTTFKNLTIVFDKSNKKLHFFIGNEQFEKSIKIDYIPDKIKILRLTSKFCNFLMWDSKTFSNHKLNLATKKLEDISIENWNSDEPILDIDIPNSIYPGIYYIVAISGEIWKLDNSKFEDLNEGIINVSNSISFRAIFKINNRCLAISKTNEVYCIECNNSSKTKKIATLVGDFLSYKTINKDLVIISTTSSIYEVKTTKIYPEFEIPIKGLTKDIVRYNDSLSMLYTNYQLIMISNETLKIQAILNLPNIKHVKFGTTIISVISNDFDTGLSICGLFEYSKDERKFQKLRLPNVNLQNTPTYFDPMTANLCVGCECRNFILKHSPIINLPEPVSHDFNPIKRLRCISYVSILGKFLCVDEANSIAVKTIDSVKNSFVNNDGNLLICNKRKINLLCLKTLEIFKGVKIEPNLKIVWINKALLSVGNEKINVKPGNFLIAIAPGFVYKEIKIKESFDYFR
jgi:hypothetical protein